MKLDKHDHDEDHDRNKRRPRPPLFDTSLTGEERPEEDDRSNESDISARGSSRLTKAR